MTQSVSPISTPTTDAGTSVTFEVIKCGVFEGGIIANGLRLLKSGLTGGGASQLQLQLPSMGGEEPLPALLGKGTIPCMTSGIVYALLGTVEIVKKRVEATHGISPYVIATGGDAPFLATNLEGSIDLLIPDLVHQGVVECVKFHESFSM
jgi:pantothenate kinase type III